MDRLIDLVLSQCSEKVQEGCHSDGQDQPIICSFHEEETVSNQSQNDRRSGLIVIILVNGCSLVEQRWCSLVA